MKIHKQKNIKNKIKQKHIADRLADGPVKNPIGYINSTDEFLRFQVISEANRLNYETLLQFGNSYTNYITQESPTLDVADLCTIFYIRGLIRGYSTVFKMSRQDSRENFNQYLKEINDFIKMFLEHHKINPNLIVKKKSRTQSTQSKFY